MNKVGLFALVSLFVGLGTLDSVAVTHTIINKSDRPIAGVVYYKGKVDWGVIKSCRPDQGLIQPGQSLVSNAYGCLLDFVQIQDGDKIIKLKVANASATIAKNVGLVVGFILVAAAVVMITTGGDSHPVYIYDPYPSSSSRMFSDLNELIVYAGVSTVWEYDGVSLVPKIGVKAYGRHDFTKSN